MAEFMYGRGARRSTAPSFERMLPTQTAVGAANPQLLAIMRQAMQPQQARQADPRMQDSSGMVASAASGADPQLLQALIRSAATGMQRPTIDGGFGAASEAEGVPRSQNGEVNETRDQANMGPASPSVTRALKMALQFGIGALIGGPMGAVLSASLRNPDSPTAPAAGLLTNVVKQAVPGLGAIELGAQMFGVDPVQKVVDRQLQELTRAASISAPAQVAGSPTVAGGAPTSFVNGNPIYNGSGPNVNNLSLDSFGDYTGSGPSFRDTVSAGGPSINARYSGDDGESDGQTGSSNGGQGGVRGGGSFGEGQY